MIKVWWKNIQTSPIMFIKIYEEIVNNRFSIVSIPSHFYLFSFRFYLDTFLSRLFFFFFLPFSSFYQFVKECEIKLLKECESSKLRSDVARLTTNDPFLLALLHFKLPFSLPLPSSSPAYPWKFRYFRNGRTRKWGRIFSCVSSSILLVLTLLAEQLIFQYSNIKIQVHTVLTIRFFHTRCFIDYNTIRRRGKINR